MLAGVGGYFGLRAWAGIKFGAWAAQDPIRLAGGALAAFGYYLLKVVVPWPQHHYVSKLPSLWAALPPVALAAAASWWAWRKAGAARSLALLSLAWLVAAILPPLAVSAPTLAVTSVAERYLYLPSVGIALLFGLWALHADFSRTLQKAGLAAAAALIVAFAASVVERTGVWQGDLEFWTEAARSPDAAEVPLVISNLAEALQTAERYDEARRWYGRAYDLFTDPADRMKIMANLGAMELAAGRKSLDAGDPAAAIAHCDRGIGYLEPVLLSPLHMDGVPNAAMGSLLLLKHKSLLLLDGKGDGRLLERAARHFEIARYTMRDRPDVVAGLAEIRRLQGQR
jgi:tetratricopeptide (TPR) repeat protein